MSDAPSLQQMWEVVEAEDYVKKEHKRTYDKNWRRKRKYEEPGKYADDLYKKRIYRTMVRNGHIIPEDRRRVRVLGEEATSDFYRGILFSLVKKWGKKKVRLMKDTGELEKRVMDMLSDPLFDTGKYRLMLFGKPDFSKFEV